MIFITHKKSGGRAGHQYKDAITPIIVAEIFGFTYVHTHYASLEMFDLGRGRLRREDLAENISVYRVEGPHWRGVAYDQLVSDFSSFQAAHQDDDCLIVLANSYRVQLFQTYMWYKAGQLQRNVYQNVVNVLRENFRARNPQPVAQCKPNTAVIAVHIRRGDVAKNRKRRVASSQHYVHDMEYYDSILRRLEEQLHDQDLDIHFYTEHANSEDVAAYCQQRPHIHLHLGGEAEFVDHFTAMVYSDILVVSNSSMSQMAGYLSKGLKIYHPNNQYHSLPEDEFIPVDKLSKAPISRQLAQRLR